ncbi:MAG: DUF4267 domain-containing protein [Bacteroidota bacterium]
MKTTYETQQWGIRSASFWMTLLVAAGIIFIGVRFIVSPGAGAAGYGIPLISNDDLPFGRIKGIRDIFSGVALLPLLLLRMRKATAWVFTSAIVVPAADFLIVLSANGSSDISHLMIHGSTVAYMAITSFLLFKS